MRNFVAAIILALPIVASGQADQQSASSGDYFRDVGLMIGELRNTQWVGEICGELLPSSKAANDAAYLQWVERYKSFIGEMEGQFSVIERYWRNLPPQFHPASGPPSIEKFKARIEEVREPLRKNFLSLSPAQLNEMCAVRFPSALGTKRYDLEVLRAGRVASIRRGPQ